jgi:hypothetical protein
MRTTVAAAVLAMCIALPVAGQQGMVCNMQDVDGLPVDENATQVWNSLMAAPALDAMQQMAGQWYGETPSLVGERTQMWLQLTPDGRMDGQMQSCGDASGTNCIQSTNRGMWLLGDQGNGVYLLMTNYTGTFASGACVATYVVMNGPGAIIDAQTGQLLYQRIQ